MTVKWLGAILIAGGCGGVGFAMAAAYRREGRILEALAQCLQWMACELQYRVTPLPQLFGAMAGQCGGKLQALFETMARELESQISPDAGSCMDAALSKVELPESVAQILGQLGRSLGQFDLRGQLEQLAGVEAACRRALEEHLRNRDSRIRSCQTLGLCAGAGIVILFL